MGQDFERPAAGGLGRRLRAARSRAFVGRTAEMELFRRALVEARDSPIVLYVTGLAGIGKSTLLRQFGDEAAAAYRTVVEIDGRVTVPTVPAFEAAARAVADEHTVLLIDTFEGLGPIEGWIRDVFLPSLPAGVLVVICGREPPDAGWRADPGWADALRVIPLSDLSPDEADTLLAARGISGELRSSVREFACEHPLALSLSAEDAPPRVRTGPPTGPTGWTPSPGVLSTLLSWMVGDLPSPEHRRALEVCAHVDVTTESVLRAMVPAVEAGDLFGWLRGLPFMETGKYGLRPHDVVRNVIDSDLRWRDPQRYREMHNSLFVHHFETARAATGSAVLSTAASLLYLQRYAGYSRGWFSAKAEGEVFEDTLRPGDREAVLKIAAEVQPQESLDILAFWLDRRPEAFRVYRAAGNGEMLAYLNWLCFSDVDEEELAADPVVVALWNHVRRTKPLRAGERIALTRFAGQAGPPPSPALNLVGARSLAGNLHTDQLAWACIALRDPELWSDNLLFGDSDPLTTVRVGGRTYGVFGTDMRVAPLETWFAQFRLPGDTLKHTPSAGKVDIPALEGIELEVLSREEFDEAVRSALRSWHRPDGLSASPLLRSRLVADSGSDEPVAALRKALSDGVAKLAEDPRAEKTHRAVAATYLHGLSTQQAAAERLGLPFSTYRRHLTRGLKRVCDVLWQRELRGGAGRMEE